MKYAFTLLLRSSGSWKIFLIRDLDAFTLWSHFTFSTPAFEAFLLLIYTIHMQRSNFHNNKTNFGSRTLEQMERARRYSGFYGLSSNHNRYVLDFQYKTIKKITNKTNSFIRLAIGNKTFLSLVLLSLQLRKCKFWTL